MKRSQVYRPTGNDVLDAQNLDFDDFLKRLFRDVPYLNGRAIKNVNLVSGNNSIAHGLGRAFEGFWFTKRSSAATYFLAANSNPEQFLVINSSGNNTVDIWVY
jgi:hypothetical protein